MTKGFADADTINGKYKTIEHTADIGIKVTADTLEQLFASSACAMFDLMVDISKVKPTQKAEISLEADSLEALLVVWLNELIFRAEVSGMFFSRFEVDSVTERAIKASAMGEPYDEKIHATGEQMKAATYHQLEIIKSNGGWSANIIFDV